MPMSCARIHPSLFDGDAARQHTAHSVDALVQSKSYAAYTRHCRYRERLFLLWFIAPIAVALVLGYHMVVFGAMESTGIVYNMHSGRRMRYGGGGGVSAMRALQRSVRDVHLVDLDRKQQLQQQQQHNNSSNKGWDDVVALLQTSRHMHKIMYDEVPGLGYVTMALALYVLPCVMVLPYISFFDDEPVSRRSSRRHLLYATAVSALMCAAGGTWWHAPPFALAQPSLLPLLRSALSSTTTTMSTSRTALVCRVLGMVALRTTVTQGLLIASYAVSRWQRSFWRRAWHVPLPLLTVPLLVGVVGAVCACLALPFVATLSAHSAHARTASPSLPAMLTVVERLRTALWLRQRDDVEHAVAWVGQQLAQHIALSTAYAQLVLRGVLTYSLYVAALQMTLLHVVVLLTRGVVLYMLGGLLRLLPTQPTLWTLCTLAAAGAVAVQLFSGSSSSSSSNNNTSYSGNDHSGGDARNVNTSSNVNMDALVTPYGLTTLAILVSLLYNGFVA